MYASGNRSIALGIDTKVITKGKCNHPNKRHVVEERLKDGLPILKFEWTHCIFCHNDCCMFGGECSYRSK